MIPTPQTRNEPDRQPEQDSHKRRKSIPIHRMAGRMIAGATGVFPVMLHSTLAPEDSLSAFQNAAARHGLAIALVWWPIAFVFAVVYFLFLYRHYAGKVRPKEDNQNPY